MSIIEKKSIRWSIKEKARSDLISLGLAPLGQPLASQECALLKRIQIGVGLRNGRRRGCARRIRSLADGIEQTWSIIKKRTRDACSTFGINALWMGSLTDCLAVAPLALITWFPGEGLAKKLVSEEKWKTKLFGLNLNLIALVGVRIRRVALEDKQLTSRILPLPGAWMPRMPCLQQVNQKGFLLPNRFLC